jgi:hypothetical protein
MARACHANYVAPPAFQLVDFRNIDTTERLDSDMPSCAAVFMAA